MLSWFEVLHAIPAFLFVYGGVRVIFNHDVAIWTCLSIATVVFIGTYISPKILKSQQDDTMQARCAEQTDKRVKANLERVKSLNKKHPQ
mgnify:CR=1 FL=1